MGSNVMECNYGIHRTGHPAAITGPCLSLQEYYEISLPAYKLWQLWKPPSKIPSLLLSHSPQLAGGCSVGVCNAVVHNGTTPSWMRLLTVVVDDDTALAAMLRLAS
ncbi:SUF system Fe-S cluster assembly regulator [Sesbania bispinosa]|nr:SUF system Fe-S cluster assembly regulator [Sesbania bispinosa]